MAPPVSIQYGCSIITWHSTDATEFRPPAPRTSPVADGVVPFASLLSMLYYFSRAVSLFIALSSFAPLYFSAIRRTTHYTLHTSWVVVLHTPLHLPLALSLLHPSYHWLRYTRFSLEFRDPTFCLFILRIDSYQDLYWVKWAFRIFISKSNNISFKLLSN